MDRDRYTTASIAASIPQSNQNSALYPPKAMQDRPQEPCLHAKADELIRWLCELEQRTARIDDLLYGEKDNKAGSDPRRAPSSLEEKLADACTRAASLCGLASTIGNKLAGE